MRTSFSDLVERREFGHYGIDNLLWVKTDRGAFGNENDGPMFDWISEHEQWIEPCRSKRVVVQAGGNCGMYPLLYSQIFEWVYTFEPEPVNFHCLVANNDRDNVFKFQAALGNSNIPAVISGGSDANVGTFKTRSDSNGSLATMMIDQLELIHCDLIHLDTEGSEQEILEGAEKTIERHRPVIITEKQRGSQWLAERQYIEHYRGRMDTVYIPQI